MDDALSNGFDVVGEADRVLQMAGRRRGRATVEAMCDAVARAAASWPEHPSPILRLAALAHGIDELDDAEFSQIPRRLRGVADAGEAGAGAGRPLLLAALTLLERVDYFTVAASAVTRLRGAAMVLRDALTDHDDRETISAAVRWETLCRLELRTPDQLLATWKHHLSFMPADVEDYRDEFANTLDIRDALEWYVGLLSWKGREQWRPHIEPVDESFRELTHRADVPLALRGRDAVRPAAWWRYRLPSGIGPDVRLLPSLSPRRYVSPPARRIPGLRSFSHVWELAERPGGITTMTDAELSRWATLTARQAAASGANRWWQDRDQVARREVLRRASR